MERKHLILGLTLQLLFANACSNATTNTDEVFASSSEIADGKADAARSLRARTGNTTVYVDTWLTHDTRENDAQVLVLRGRSSRNITDGFGFVLDDPYGQWAKRGARSFELTWSSTEAASIAGGVNQFIRLMFTPSHGRPDSLTAHVTVRPQLKGFMGSGARLSADLVPVVVGSRTVFRMSGSLSRTTHDIRVEVGSRVLSGVTLTDSRHFVADVLLDDLLEAFLTDTPFTVVADGHTVKQASAAFLVQTLGLTDGDPYEEWPRPECTDEVRTCLQGLPTGAVDLSSCGEARDVLACGLTRVTFDEFAFSNKMGVVNARLADTAGFAIDMVGLIGTERANQFQDNVGRTIESHLEQHFGQTFSTTDEMNSIIDADIEGVIDEAYAYPLNFADPLEPIPGNMQRERDVAADGLLTYLANFDFEHSLFDAPYLQVIQLNRAWHVSSIRAFREQATPDAWSPNPAWNNYVGNWTNPYVEIRVDRATCTVADILFEID